MTAKLSPLQLRNFQKRLLRWFSVHKRDLPWRASRDPYRVWIAEVMLQQTRIAAVMPYYQRFLQCLPDVKSLARAPLVEVLKLWSGLGYYSRAGNLRRSAFSMVMSRASSRGSALFAATCASPVDGVNLQRPLRTGSLVIHPAIGITRVL